MYNSDGFKLEEGAADGVKLGIIVVTEGPPKDCDGDAEGLCISDGVKLEDGTFFLDGRMLEEGMIDGAELGESVGDFVGLPSIFSVGE